DGAGAAVFQAAEGDEGGVISTFTAADGTLGEALHIDALPVEKDPFGSERPQVGEKRYLAMSGNDVFRFTAQAVPAAIEQALTRAGKTADEVDWFVLHQANYRILKMVAKRYGLEESKLYINLERFGNTSSASVPLCLAEMKQKNLLHEGQLILLAGFGGGLTYGSALIRL
ncbi:MAG: 3-oxoacyl-[acyl-carrier-protein] synthase III C-terminal domain-containing protein, partial [Agathobaculum sp.]|uniref:3-oxoacyl-[acyl-carrier-protein] synthase III C-terminal domain-containing protein n=1 Tax=Agathobaculum sp. TaxID=2048138 RepID=UPI003D923363